MKFETFISLFCSCFAKKKILRTKFYLQSKIQNVMLHHIETTKKGSMESKRAT